MAVTRTHRPAYTPEKCLPCGTCSSRCPATVFVEQALEADSLRGRVARQRKPSADGSRPPMPPCRAACPLGQDVPAYVAALARGDVDGAAEIVYRSNPLPSVCGRLCLEACAQACVRGGLDAPVAIRTLKRAAVENASRRPTPIPAATRRERVAVIGAGPAGLAAAFQLRRLGILVTVFEAAAEAGGMLRFAVPTFELPRRILADEVAAIAAMGVDFVFDSPVSDAASVGHLLGQGYRAVVLATGAGHADQPAWTGAAGTRCQTAVDFARLYAEGAGPELKDSLAVIGAGREAVAVARLALRAGAGPVHLIMRRSRSESPADPRKLALAEREGVHLLTETRPVALEPETLVLAPVIYGPPDAVGRRWPLRVPGGESGQVGFARLDVARIVIAEGRRSTFAGLTRTPQGAPVLAADGSLAGLPGVFAAGDALTGQRNVIEAMATGVRAAAKVMRSLRGSGS